VKNCGNRTAVLKLDPAPINIAELRFKEDGSSDIVRRIASHIYVLGSQMLDASGLAILLGETKICRSLVPVNTSGLYLVSLFAYRPRSEEVIANAEGMSVNDHAALWFSQYV